MHRGLFVTGTDTNVGKTVLSALLTAALDAVYWKPIQSGAVEGTDRKSVMRWAEIPEDRAPAEQYCFDPPVSPHLAAREAGMEIHLADILLPSTNGSPLIVEGAGGVLVPINANETMLDLIRHLGLPVVIASRTALGTINHTLLTVSALRAAGVHIFGVAMLGPPNRENRLAIERYGGVPVIGQAPWLEVINRAALLNVFETGFEKSKFESMGLR